MMYDETILKLLDQGLTAYGLGNLEEALTAWRRVIELDPDNARAWDYIKFIEKHWASTPLSSPATQLQPPVVEPIAPTAYTPPAKSILQSNHWGDIYEGQPPQTDTQSSVQNDMQAEIQPPPQPDAYEDMHAEKGAYPLADLLENAPAIAPEELYSPEPAPVPQPPVEAPRVASTLPPRPVIPPAVIPEAPDIVSALDLVTAPAPPAPEELVPEQPLIEPLLKTAEERMALHDFSGALEALGELLSQNPDHQRALSMREEAEQQLTKMLFSKLGNLDRVPKVCMRGDEIIWLNLDHRAGFVLSLVDGTISFDEILMICGLSQFEGMRILVQLLQHKVIKVD